MTTPARLTRTRTLPVPASPAAPSQPGSDDTGPPDPYSDHPSAGQPGAGSQSRGGPAAARPDLDELIGPDPRDPFARPRPRAARRAAARAGQPGWLTGKAAAAYTCDAKIAPMVCGHLDRNLLARLVTDWLAGDLANLVTGPDPVPAPGPRCACDEHPPAPRAAIPGALPPHRPARRHRARPGPPPATASPVPPGLTGPADPGAAAGTGAPGSALTPGGLARLQDTLLRYAVSLLSGPAGLAAYLRTQLTGGFFPAPSLPLDLGAAHRASPPAPAPRRDQAGPALLLPRLHRTRPSAATSTTSSPAPKAARPAWTTSPCCACSTT